jgi:hypothetical protein
MRRSSMANLYGMATRARKAGNHKKVLHLSKSPMTWEEQKRLVRFLEKDVDVLQTEVEEGGGGNHQEGV